MNCHRLLTRSLTSTLQHVTPKLPPVFETSYSGVKRSQHCGWTECESVQSFPIYYCLDKTMNVFQFPTGCFDSLFKASI